jgi:hypothetical protein
MQLPESRFFSLASGRRAALLLALGALLGACDRHTAGEAPESYGHGSSHDKSYSDHQIDSRDHSASFSDTRGQDAAASESAAPTSPEASPTPAGAPSQHLAP